MFSNAFTRQTEEFLSNGIEFPTGSLTQVLLFPDRKPCLHARGSAFQHFGAGDAELKVCQPRVLENGRLVHWHVVQPAPHYSYLIQWNW
jgi:hypothetical protein